MFTNTQNDRDRLQAWRQFRMKFSRTTGTEQEVVEAFASIKPAQRYLDYYTPDSWPSVFEIVKEGEFCQTGITLVMGSTLHYLGFIKSDQLEFDVVSNHITGQEGLVLVYEDEVYNFLPGEIVSVDFMKKNATIFDRHIIATDNFYS